MTQAVQERQRTKSLAKAPRAKSKGMPKPVLGLIGVLVFLGAWELMPVLGDREGKVPAAGLRGPDGAWPWTWA